MGNVGLCGGLSKRALLRTRGCGGGLRYWVTVEFGTWLDRLCLLFSVVFGKKIHVIFRFG